jgi:hypothetical protein
MCLKEHYINDSLSADDVYLMRDGMDNIMIERIKSRIPELKVKLAEFFGETKH